MAQIAEFLAKPYSPTWHEETQSFLKELLLERYGANGLKAVSLRVPMLSLEKAPFAAILHKDSPASGGYGGTSFVIFPSEQGAFFSLGIGTQGLAPDEDILSSPGHARFCRAFSTWVNSHEYSAWSKADPTRIDLPLAAPELLSDWPAAVQKYGNLLYVTVKPSAHNNVDAAFFALLDFYMRERHQNVLVAHKQQSSQWQEAVRNHVLVSPTLTDIAALLQARRFVILQGPPGTGKTHTALELLKNSFDKVGDVFQFHPSTSYEQFIGGLAPAETNGSFGFRPTPGILMRAAKAATDAQKPYLLVLDEVNRADLSRVLGEALFLFEQDNIGRKISLPYSFGEGHGKSFSLPPNLFVLGTMNSADRSTAILDLAVRRRFAFISIWPTRAPLLDGPALALEAFDRLSAVFMSEATSDALEFLPGHSYFLAATAAEAKARLRHELRPLLTSYFDQSLVPSMADALDSYVQWLDTL